MLPLVYVLTECRRLADLWESLLIFPTLRQAFPTAQIRVLENASTPAARHSIRECATQCDAELIQYERPAPYPEYLARRLQDETADSIVLVSSKTVFWDSVESWEISGLLGGRKVPLYWSARYQAVVHEHFDTTFLWFPKLSALRETIPTIKLADMGEFIPLRPYCFRMNDQWHRFELCGSLYAACLDRMHAFSEIQSASFDHLATSLCPWPSAVEADCPRLRQWNSLRTAAQSNIEALRGIWQWQKEQLESCQTDILQG